jgi:hypothetical protein
MWQPSPERSATLGVDNFASVVERSDLVLSSARVLHVNGQSTHETVAAAERLGNSLGLRATIIPRWGELQLQAIDGIARLVSFEAANPTGVDMDRVASAMGAIDEVAAGRLAPPAVLETINTIAHALWQAGGNLGAYLGLLTSPSGMSSANTCRLDSWWLEKRWLHERVTARVGQFAGQDFYGTQHYAASFIFEPMGYALGNLFNTFESFDPPSTPAFEVRVVPLHNLYVKSMVEAEDREPFAHNPTGLVPQFRGVPVSISEIGFTPGKEATSVRAFDNVESRKGYSGLYQFGASYNPGKFKTPTSTKPKSGNYRMYWMASQAIWRVHAKEAKGLDATFAYDWSPADINRNNTMLTAGLRFNEPLPLRIHNTMSLGYVQNRLSQQFVPTACHHGSRSTVLNSTRFWTSHRCSFCSRLFNITQTSAEERSAP